MVKMVSGTTRVQMSMGGGHYRFFSKIKTSLLFKEGSTYSLIFCTLLIGFPSHCEAIFENIRLEPVV
jgi:hypothetical protein